MRMRCLDKIHRPAQAMTTVEVAGSGERRSNAALARLSTISMGIPALVLKRAFDRMGRENGLLSMH